MTFKGSCSLGAWESWPAMSHSRTEPSSPLEARTSLGAQRRCGVCWGGGMMRAVGEDVESAIIAEWSKL